MLRTTVAVLALAPLAGAFSVARAPAPRAVPGNGRTTGRRAAMHMSSPFYTPPADTAAPAPGGASELATPPVANFKYYWDKVPPVYDSSTRVSQGIVLASRCHHRPKLQYPGRVPPWTPHKVQFFATAGRRGGGGEAFLPDSDDAICLIACRRAVQLKKRGGLHS